MWYATTGKTKVMISEPLQRRRSGPSKSRRHWYGVVESRGAQVCVCVCYRGGLIYGEALLLLQQLRNRGIAIGRGSRMMGQFCPLELSEP